MAGLKRCLGVDFGASRIKVAEIIAEKTKLRLSRLLLADVDIPPGTDEEERSLRLTRALRDLLKSNKVTTRDAVFCVPGQSVIYRPIKLPKTSPERLLRIIEYEARQQVPFPLDQTHFEFQVFEDEENPEEVEVLLVAIKRETVNSFVRLFRRAGLRIASIGVSYLALFNYHQLDAGRVRFGEKPKKEKEKKPAKEKPLEEGKKKDKKRKLRLSLFQKKKKKAPGIELADDEELATVVQPKEAHEAFAEAPSEGEDLFGAGGLFEEVKAYVNLGATMMDLAIEKQSRKGVVGFCRAIPHAGNEMTRAVQKALALDSFREAEEVKRARTVALSSQFETEGVRENISQEASEAVTRLIDRSIIGELRRSLDFYISQPDGVAVDGILLSGGQANLPHLASYIEEKLGIPVEVVEQFHNEAVEISDSVDSADLPSGLVAIGLALQGVGAAAIGIDFLPEGLKTVREFKGKYREVAAMAALIIGMIALSYNVGEHTAGQLSARAEELKTRNDPKVKDVLVQFQALATARRELKAKYENMAKIVAPRDLWLEFWAQLLVEKPPEVVIDKVFMNANSTIVVEGVCETQGPITNFLDRLSGRKDLVADIKVDELMFPAPDEFNRFRLDQLYFFRINMRHVGKHSRLRNTPPPTPTP